MIGQISCLTSIQLIMPFTPEIKPEIKHKKSQKSLKHARTKDRTLEQITLEHCLDLMLLFDHLKLLKLYSKE